MRISAAVLVWLFTSLYGYGVSAAGSNTVAVLDAIHEMEQTGHRIVYSTDLIRPGTRIQVAAGRPITVSLFKDGLEAIGLTLESDDQGIYYIVPLIVDGSSGGLTGRVTDATTGKPLAGVRIEIAGAEILTDAQGRFYLPPEAAEVVVTLDGYEAAEVSTSVVDDYLEIPLQPYLRLEEIVVVSSRYALRRPDGTSLHTLHARDINTIPELGDDALRASNHLPGTASIGLSAKPYIRGGLQDEILVMFNNVELLEPFHLKDFQSAFSGFNPSLIDTIDVYTGGFPVRYGDRMSGVMDIQPTTDITDFGAEVMVSFLTASASAVGTTNDSRGRWALSARRGNLDLILDLAGSKLGDPLYSDYYGSFAYEMNDDTGVEVGFIVYNDDVTLAELDEGDGELAESHYENTYGWAQLHRQWSPTSSSTTLLSYGSIDHFRRGFINDEDLEEGSSSLNDQRAFDIWSLGHQQYIEPSEIFGIEFGGRLNYQSGRYDTQSVIQRGVLGDLIGLPETDFRWVRRKPEGTSGSLYASSRWLPTGQMAFEAGLRWDFQDYTEIREQHISPRVSVRWDVRESTTLRLSAGRFYQPEQIHELQAADGVDRFQRAQYSDHYIIGFTHSFEEIGLKTHLEAFYKTVQNPKRRHENLFNSLVLVPEITSDRIRLAPTEARARGVEMTIDYSPRSNFGTWLSYTHASADDHINGRWEKRGWDQTHTLSSGLFWQPGRWSFSAAVLWHSGWQTTYLPPLVSTEDQLPTIRRNQDRLPNFFSLDVKVSRSWEWERQSITLFAEVTNALDRNNVGAIEYDIEEAEDPGEGIYLVTGEPVTLLPLIPSIGFRWSFD